MNQQQEQAHGLSTAAASDATSAAGTSGTASGAMAQTQTPGIVRLGMGATLSEAAICNGVVYLAGQVADDLSKNIAGQTTEVLAHVDRLLAQAGSDRTRILMCQIFLADIKDFDAMNQVWTRWVAAGHAPPRATVEAKLARPEWLVEMVVTAAVSGAAATATTAAA